MLHWTTVIECMAYGYYLMINHSQLLRLPWQGWQWMIFQYLVQPRCFSTDPMSQIHLETDTANTLNYYGALQLQHTMDLRVIRRHKRAPNRNMNNLYTGLLINVVSDITYVNNDTSEYGI